MNHLLTALYELTLLEKERVLTDEEIRFYIYSYNTLIENKVIIPFEVEI